MLRTAFFTLPLLAACAEAPYADGEGAPYEELPLLSDADSANARVSALGNAPGTNGGGIGGNGGGSPDEEPTWGAAHLPAGTYAMSVEAVGESTCGDPRPMGPGTLVTLDNDREAGGAILWGSMLLEGDGENGLRIANGTARHLLTGTRCELVERVEAAGLRAGLDAFALDIRHSIFTVGEDCGAFSAIAACEEEYVARFTLVADEAEAGSPVAED